MHPIYYALLAVGVLLVINGLSGMKEKGTYFSLYQFATWSVVISTLPMGLPILGYAMASAFWWSSTFIMIGLGFVFMSYSVRSMRQGQYSQLDEVLASADRAFEARRYDEALRFYSQGITLTHSLYSDAVFTMRNPRVRTPVGGTSVPEEYFRPWIGKAKCLALTGKLRKALAIYELMLEVDPDLPEVWVDRGLLLLVEKRYAEAYISFDRAVKLDPASEEARRQLAQTLEIIRRVHA
jgi:tetratricopeptide (TPR) repeat protein